ncbi:FecR/PupR family sigma factor regulator [Variovorax sp. VaC1]|uniref:FecR/PupR family sigma factor regulator n=1 Tax=Variovorax sp. VaC1 TaxID=3373132 RepID=UPI00374A9722
MKQDKDDPVWDAAWQWVQREHDADSFDESARAEMTAWLLAQPAHRRAYDRAAQLWLLAGFVPPTNDFGDGDGDSDDVPDTAPHPTPRAGN